jgi:hypothetical protein
MEHQKKYLPPLIILILFVSLIIGFRSFLMANIVEPIALLFWAVWRLISSVDQNTYWMFLILICVFLVIYLVAAGRQRAPRSAYHEVNNSLNRVEYWQKLIREASLGNSEREYLSGHLRDLRKSAGALVERPVSSNSDSMNAKEDVSLTPSAHRFLYPPKGKNGKRSISHPLDILSFAPKWLRGWIRKILYQDNPLIDEILQSMENKLEISNEK